MKDVKNYKPSLTYLYDNYIENNYAPIHLMKSVFSNTLIINVIFEYLEAEDLFSMMRTCTTVYAFVFGTSAWITKSTPEARKLFLRKNDPNIKTQFKRRHSSFSWQIKVIHKDAMDVYDWFLLVVEEVYDEELDFVFWTDDAVDILTKTALAKLFKGCNSGRPTDEMMTSDITKEFILPEFKMNLYEWFIISHIDYKSSVKFHIPTLITMERFVRKMKRATEYITRTHERIAVCCDMNKIAAKGYSTNFEPGQMLLELGNVESGHRAHVALMGHSYKPEGLVHLPTTPDNFLHFREANKCFSIVLPTTDVKFHHFYGINL